MPTEILDILGAPSTASQRVSQQQFTDAGILETAGAAFQTNNIGFKIWDWADRKLTHQPEEGFDVEQYWEDNKGSIPIEYGKEFEGVKSTAEADALKAAIERDLHNMQLIGAKGDLGLALGFATGIVDVDLPLALVTGGTSKFASTGARAAYGAATGAATAMALEATGAALSPTKGYGDVITGGLFGSLLGGVGGVKFNKSVHKTAAEFTEAIDPEYGYNQFDTDVSPVVAPEPVYTATPDVSVEPTKGPMTFEVDGIEKPQQFSSVGAAGPATPDFDYASMSGTSQKVYDEAVQANQQSGVYTKLEGVDLQNFDAPSRRIAERFIEGINHIPGLKTDYDNLVDSSSVIETRLAYDLFESAEGRARNATSAAMLQDAYYKQLATRSMIPVNDAFSKWAKERNMNFFDQQNPAKRDMFDRDVVLELERRYWEGVEDASVNPHVKQAADAIDDNMSHAVDVGKGREGEASIAGFETIEKKSGYYRHKWDGAKMRKLMKEKGIRERDLVAALAVGYRKSMPGLSDADRLVFSRAVIRRAMRSEEGVDSNLITTLDADGRAYLEEVLLDNGTPKPVIERLMRGLTGKAEERGKLGQTKQRMQVDLRTKVGDLQLVDLIETNLNRSLSMYNRQIAGSAALARKGITSKAKKKEIIDAAVQERAARGIVDPDRREYLEKLFTHFDAGPIAGGLDPRLVSAKRITNLALLNQLGLTQLAEAGPAIAEFGWKEFARLSGNEFKQLFSKGTKSPILEELKPLLGEIGSEHKLFRDDLALDEMRADAADAGQISQIIGKIERGTAAAQRAQGYISGFYKVRQMQQRVAVAGMANKVIQNLRDGTNLDRMADLAIDPKIKKYIDNGTVEFMQDGTVNKLNLDKWDAADAEAFALSLNRSQNQIVQKAMAGEDSIWMHSDMGSLFMHLKSFPMTAMRKQAARNLKIGDSTTMTTFLWAMATAGTVFMAKQIINGRGDDMDAEKIIKGAFGLSNMTGFIPMWTDPLASMLGMDDLKFSQYGRSGVDTGIIAVPPAIPTLNRMLHAPGALNPFGDMSHNERIRTMQAMPLIGNLYGFSALFNAMKE